MARWKCNLKLRYGIHSRLTAIEGIPLVKPGDDLADAYRRGWTSAGLRLAHGDIVVVCQKVVSKSEGRIFDLKQIEPSAFAINIAARWEKDPRAVELVLRQTNRIVRMDRGVLIVETGPGMGLRQRREWTNPTAWRRPRDPAAGRRRRVGARKSAPISSV